jgi:hypothetical protein
MARSDLWHCPTGPRAARPTEPSWRGVLSCRPDPADPPLGGPSPARGEPLAESILSCLADWHGRATDMVSPRPAALARPRRSDEEVCRPPSPIRLGWPDRAYGTAPPAPLARLNRHGEACCHAGPTRLARRVVGPSEPGRAITVNPVGSLYKRFGISHKPKSGAHSLHCKHHYTRPSPRLHARAVADHEVAAPPLEPTRTIRGQLDVSGRATSSPAHHLESQGYPGSPNIRHCHWNCRALNLFVTDSLFLRFLYLSRRHILKLAEFFGAVSHSN